jgi:hypothetical protein
MKLKSGESLMGSGPSGVKGMLKLDNLWLSRKRSQSCSIAIAWIKIIYSIYLLLTLA